MNDPGSLEALRFWHRLSIAQVRGGQPDLSTRQMAILLEVYLNTAPPHSVRGLSDKLGLSKPVISRALDKMGRLGFIKRTRDDTDCRNVLIHRTVDGAMYLSELAGLLQGARQGPDGPE